MKTLSAIIVVLGAALFADAHEDVIITVDGSSLIGLPQQYLPARLDVQKGVLTIGQRTMQFTPFIHAFFTDHKDPKLSLSASWYHPAGLLPPYLNVQIIPEPADFYYQLLFNLDTLDVVWAQIHVRKANGELRSLPIEISEVRQKAIRESIKLSQW